jgi:hypothetical protein
MSNSETRVYTEKAHEAAERNIAEIKNRLNILQQALNEYEQLDPSEIHWGHVGDLAYGNNGLKELVEFYTGKEG